MIRFNLFYQIAFFLTSSGDTLCGNLFDAVTIENNCFYYIAPPPVVTPESIVCLLDLRVDFVVVVVLTAAFLLLRVVATTVAKF